MVNNKYCNKSNERHHLLTIHTALFGHRETEWPSFFIKNPNSDLMKKGGTLEV